MADLWHYYQHIILKYHKKNENKKNIKNKKTNIKYQII